jgi:LysR family transcriptional regulator, low CO2-responsive transcriptional regulator
MVLKSSMQLDQLVAFDRIAREGTFSRAAVALGLGQPAVSARILALEDAVGGTLFVRGRTLRLTALGESFLPFARRALEVLREGVEASRLAQIGERGSLRIGVLGSLAGGLVAPALAEFVRARPHVECHVRSGDHEFLLQLLLDGIVDVALTVWPCTSAVELTPLFLFREPVVLVAHPRHALARRGHVTRDEVARLARPLLRLRWWQSHDPRILRLAEDSHTSVEVAMEVGRRLVSSGVGAGFFVRTYIAEELDRGTLAEIPVRGLNLFRDSALVRRRHSGPISPALAAFIELLRRRALQPAGGVRRKRKAPA